MLGNVGGIKMNEACDISIIIAVYNHACYIRKAIDSVLMQKTKYSYEVLIGEDCSTDSSREVLKSIEHELPSNFYIFYREHNYGAKRNFEDLYMRMNGKYYIVLEGDDYWTYEYKLQEECDFLEKHPEYLAVAHNTMVVGIDNQPIPFSYPECHKNEYDISDFVKGKLPGQTTTILSRNYYKFRNIDYALDVQGAMPGDRVRAFLLAANGKVYCIQQKWSAYRFVPYTGNSFSATNVIKKGQMLCFVRYLFGYVQNHDVTPKVKREIEKMYAWYLFRAILKESDMLESHEIELFFEKGCHYGLDVLYILFKISTFSYVKLTSLMQTKKNRREKERIISLLEREKNAK